MSLTFGCGTEQFRCRNLSSVGESAFADLESAARHWLSSAVKIFSIFRLAAGSVALISRLAQPVARNGSQRRGHGDGCQWSSGTETAASGFRIACGGKLAAGGSSRFVASDRKSLKILKNHRVAAVHQYVTTGNIKVSTGVN